MGVSAPDFLEILRVLVEEEVEFIVVGALSAVFQGAPIMTFDLDIVHKRDERNINRLLQALVRLEASYRGRGEQKLVPAAEHLRSDGHQLLSTKFGPLDILGTIEDGLTYEELQPFAVEFSPDEIRFDVLSLSKYIELKESSPREKDRARLPTLRAIKDEEDLE